MKFNVITIFPKMFPGPLGESVVGKALASDLWSLNTVDIRSFAIDKHKTVDDIPYGGGCGMLMRPDVVGDAVDSVIDAESLVVNFTPRGRVFSQSVAHELIQHKNIVMLCGRYEGIDCRVARAYGAMDISMGDYIMSGGELAAMSVIDCCVRLLPGVLGNDVSCVHESFGDGKEGRYLLECDQYTRPAEWRGYKVPDVLLSGHHARIEEWRHESACDITKSVRSDLWQQHLNNTAGITKSAAGNNSDRDC